MCVCVLDMCAMVNMSFCLCLERLSTYYTEIRQSLKGFCSGNDHGLHTRGAHEAQSKFSAVLVNFQRSALQDQWRTIRLAQSKAR